MTTLRKLISEIDKAKCATEPSWEDLGNLFNIYNLYWSDDTRLKCYFIKKWYCTDSYVGMRVYFLDDEFIAISNQTGRKMTEEFEFVSKDLALKLRSYLESLVNDDENPPQLNIIDEKQLDAEISSTYKIEYNSQILHKEAFFHGKKVEIIKKSYSWKEKVEIIKKGYSWEEKDKYFHTVEIKLSNGKKEEIDCRDLDFEYNK
jgi:hypothetical protein